MIEPYEPSHMEGFRPIEHFEGVDWGPALREQAMRGTAWTMFDNQSRVSGFIGFTPQGGSSVEVWSVLGVLFKPWQARSLKKIVNACMGQGFYKKLVMRVEEGYRPGEDLARFLGFTKELQHVWVRVR